MSDVQVLTMPIRRFWMMNSTIDRINASNDIRAINVAAAVLSKESFKSSMEQLSETVGSIVVKPATRDVDAIERLKRLMV